MTLESTFDWHEIPLETPFSHSRETKATSKNVVVRLTYEDGTVGFGGATPNRYYGETRETIDRTLPDLLDIVSNEGDPHSLQRIENLIRDVVARPRSHPAARSAVSIALHDLVCKRLDLPLYRYWGLDPKHSLETCYSIGIADPCDMVSEAVAAIDEGYDTLKLKLGTENDREIVTTIRETVPSATLRVDANGAWDPETAIEMIDWLTNYDVDFVEQPVPAEDPEGMARVYKESSLPIAADESCVALSDIPKIAEQADIAVIKLSKVGGLRTAKAMIYGSRAHGLDIMLGCMIESNASIAAGAHLVPLADYVDLDGSKFLSEDPFSGVPMNGGFVDLESVNRRGTGASLVQ